MAANTGGSLLETRHICWRSCEKYYANRISCGEKWCTLYIL